MAQPVPDAPTWWRALVARGRALWRRATGEAEAERKLKVFISYSPRDAEFAGQLAEDLALAGFDVFYDRLDPVSGVDWRGRLEAFMPEADAVVFVISPEALRSEAWHWEIARAAELSKRMVPVVCSPVPDAEVPPRLARLQHVHFDGEPFEQSLAQLASALRQDSGWLRAPARPRDAWVDWRDRAAAAAADGVADARRGMDQMRRGWALVRQGTSGLLRRGERDCDRRPPGWVGYWSPRYARLRAYTFANAASADELIPALPRPFQEALDPVASAAEPRDRDGRLLRWRWHRSVTRDLIGVPGVAIGAAGILVVAGGLALKAMGAPPIVTPAPADETPLTQQQQLEQQKLPMPPLVAPRNPDRAGGGGR